jgi:hypothetical protein
MENYNIELNEQERAILVDIVCENIGTLRQQIHHSDTFEFTQELKVRTAILNGLLSRLEGVRTPMRRAVG